jgi:hypothetical protein
MFRRVKAVLTASALLFGSVVLLGQTPQAQKVPETGASSVAATGTSPAPGCVGCELPIILRQNVEAGKTPMERGSKRGW